MELHQSSVTHTGRRLALREARPISLVLKPSAAKAREIERQRRMLGIPYTYGRERFHITLLPTADARFISGSEMASLLNLLGAFEAEPFEVRLHRLSGNALRCGKTRALTRFQNRLVAALEAAGFDLPDYSFGPHLSLSYGAWQQRNAPIPPICWQAEEFLLIKSIYGQGRHELLGRWPLIPRQLQFGF